jgi:predicted neuraminidase
LFVCSLDEDAQEEVEDVFEEKVCTKLKRKANKRLVGEDEALRHMLIVEFATRPVDVHSSAKLCKLVCAFFGPLLVETKKTWTVDLLQASNKEILTRQLLTFDAKNKVLEI